MYVMINELSFIGQADIKQDAPTLMRTMMNVIRELKPIQGDDPTCTHTSLFNQPLSAEYSVDDWVTTRFANDPDRDVRRFFVVYVRKGPFIDRLLDKVLEYHECYLNDQDDVLGSSLAGAAYFTGTLVSLQDAPLFEDKFIQVRFSIGDNPYEDIKIPNLTREGQLWGVARRQYVPSPKHNPLGGWGSPMDLDDETAQRVLDRGVRYRRQIYGYHDGKFYVFQNDNAGGYHGYLIDRPPTYALRKLKNSGIL